MGYHDVAQICLNGHVITDVYKSSPEFRKAYCPKCGQPTITQCPSCGANIQGQYNDEGFVDVSVFPAPDYCHNCGKPYPWTEAKLSAISELLKLEEQIQESDIATMQEILPDILAETPKSKVAEAKFKIIMRKVGKATYEAVKDIIIEIASETIKKSLFG